MDFPRQGEIEIVCGSMFSGKTEELIRRVKRVQIARLRIQVFKHSLDDRYEVARIASHDGQSVDAVPVASAQEIRNAIDPATQVVAIDEAQFFDEDLLLLCRELTQRGLRVILAGLDTDFRGEPIGSMPLLLAEAESVDKLRAICVICGREASRTQRLVDGQPAHVEDPIILVGAKESYQARCRKCHRLDRSKREET